MTQEDKELLFKDLCARLPYQPKLQIYYEEMAGSGVFDEELWEFDGDGQYCNGGRRLEDIKPYLRLMSSMTEEERSNLRAYCRTQEGIIYNIGVAGAINCPAIIDFLNKNHFDYRGLIEKGLALEAPNGMYN